ncbi:NDMA-dependent alcohol dehydrogenase [Streptomyces sp. NPDC059904]|uniref:NDMA-dependent alcohol dehydrogenase n=1 Tax=Streptomyces sp. NPDC059904 TaxID=3346996 RepID=UPI00364FE4C4
MQTRGAVIRQAPGELEVVDLELEDPRQDEVQVKLVASGLCHSDSHHMTGDVPVGTYPFALGHEGAGVVTKAFPNSKGIEEGDHVVFTALPACGHCRWCATGQQNLCDLKAGILAGPRWTDGTYRVHTTDGAPVGQMCGISTFLADTTVSLNSVVKIDDDIPLDKAALVGCGVSTGWGSSVNLARVQPGDTVIVMGIGGIGVSALQGAAHAGALNVIAVDPLPFKQETAKVFGATHAAASIDEAAELAKQFTGGYGADSVVICVGLRDSRVTGQALNAIRKGGTVVVTSVSPHSDGDAPIPLSDLTLSQKHLVGSMFGGTSGNWDVKRLLNLYRSGALKLDEMITQTYSLDDIQQGYHDLHAGKNVRGIVVFD